MKDLVLKTSREGQTDFIYCCGVATELLRFGPCLPGCRLLFLVIPGNPGVVGFYRTFMQTIHSVCGYTHPVWAVSHAGHCATPHSMDMVEDPSAAEHGDAFGLSGQVEHKLAFIRTHVPKGTKLVLVGHSIGCYIILEMMKRSPELEVLKSVMLFPTIERMARTPQGRVLTPVLCHLRYLAYLPLFLLSLLPDRVKASLISLAFGGIHSLDRTVIQPTVQLLSGDCAANAMYMAGQEMVKVLERDNVTIGKHLGKIIFYYGATDHWCPVEYYHDLRKDFPHGDLRLCEMGFRHAFVLDAGSDVAKLVVDWVRADLRAQD
uniref:Lipid droplet-associated hydrolase n=1 Tax=Tetraodon nigroviridis TaxID=99883 RepID=H3CD22_TETNG